MHLKNLPFTLFNSLVFLSFRSPKTKAQHKAIPTFKIIKQLLVFQNLLVKLRNI